jgi:hypothetical protein
MGASCIVGEYATDGPEVYTVEATRTVGDQSDGEDDKVREGLAKSAECARDAGAAAGETSSAMLWTRAAREPAFARTFEHPSVKGETPWNFAVEKS